MITNDLNFKKKFFCVLFIIEVNICQLKKEIAKKNFHDFCLNSYTSSIIGVN